MSDEKEDEEMMGLIKESVEANPGIIKFLEAISRHYEDVELDYEEMFGEKEGLSE